MGCESCSGSCGGCAKELTLTEGEVEMLRKLAQIPFLPIARKIDDATPIYLEDQDRTIAEMCELVLIEAPTFHEE